MRFLSLLTIAVSLATHGAQADDVPEIVRQEIEAGVRKVLKDPESARFGAIWIGRTDEPTIFNVCGIVNAKNSFGGYVGDAFYMGVLAQFDLEAGPIWFFSATDVGGDGLVSGNGYKGACEALVFEKLTDLSDK